MTKTVLPCIEVIPKARAIASVIWMHGLGADGNDFVPLVPDLNLPHELPIRFIFPHAPERPVTINAGYTMRAWYDILGLDASAREDETGIKTSEIEITKLIQHEHQAGIPTDRIILAGFSQGGAMALHCGLRYPERLGGIMSLSAYLPIAYTLQQEINPANEKTPIFMAHGTQDTLVPLAWGQMAHEQLQKQNYSVEFRTYPMAHSVCVDEIRDVSSWLQKVLVR